MQKYNIANRIIGYFDSSDIIHNLMEINNDSNLKCIKDRVSKEEFPDFKSLLDSFKIAIIDFEGSPVFMCGILIQDTIICYYIESPSYKRQLYCTIFKALEIAKRLTFFAFSDHERIELLNMYRFIQVQGEDVSEYDFIEEFPIINLQKPESKYESLTEAFYSINPNSAKLTGDSLFRNNRMVDQLFLAQKLEEVIAHNRNCLVNEAILFLKRWYKHYKL